MNHIVEALKKHYITEDMAARYFIEIFEGEQEDDARIMEYLGRALEVITAEINGYVVAVFEDGSVYADSQQGIDSFFPTVEDWFAFHNHDTEFLLQWYPHLPSGLNA